jgi:subtilase family serine protease
LQVTLTSGKTRALNKRGVPDVSGDADPQTGWDVRIDGTNTVIGGTSAVAPLWAAFIARINAARGNNPVGFINPQLYASPQVLNDVTQGNNGDFAAAPGWDACTGLGSPAGAKVAQLLSGTPSIRATPNSPISSNARSRSRVNAGSSFVVADAAIVDPPPLGWNRSGGSGIQIPLSRMLAEIGIRW